MPRRVRSANLTAVERSFAQWLEFQQQLPVSEIQLGLERVREVAARLAPGPIASRVLTVAGTNGKGSCVAILAALQRAAGRRVGCYTSPHLLHYRERVRLPEGLASEAQLVDAFARVDAARAGVRLTPFEFGTLAAWYCMAQAGLDTAVLEIGLGGRLDAVNIIAPDAALITTIGLDHQALLGDTRVDIGREKAGILRPGIPAVYADQPGVASVLEQAQALGSRLQRPGVDYRYWREGMRWYFQSPALALELPWPAGLSAPCQIHNLAASLALTLALEPDFPLDAVAAGVAAARIEGRLQHVSAEPDIWLDIAHNPQAAASLAEWLDRQTRRPTLAVFGALADKDVAGVVAAISDRIEHWHLAGLDSYSPRGLSGPVLRTRMPQLATSSVHADTAAALAAACEQARRTGARVLAFGSFVLAEQVLRAARRDAD